MSKSDPIVVEFARVFATAAHAAIDQRRKYTNDPYIVHPQAVVRILSGLPRVTDQMIAASWCHDVLEDTKVSVAAMKKVFDRRVIDLVLEVTDVSQPEDGNRAERKKIDRDHIAMASPQGQTIKLADLIDNSESILEHDKEFALVYIPEKAALLDVLTKGDSILRTRACKVVEKAMKELGL